MIVKGAQRNAKTLIVKSIMPQNGGLCSAIG